MINKSDAGSFASYSSIAKRGSNSPLLLLKNKGISFLPEYAILNYVKNNQLAILDTECDEIIMWRQLVYHRNKYITPQMNLFLELMIKHISSRQN